MYCTLDELLTAEDLDSIRRQHRTDSARRLEAARRGAVSSAAGGGGGAGIGVGGGGPVVRRPLAEVADLGPPGAALGAGKVGVTRPGMRGSGMGHPEAAGGPVGLRMDTVAGSAA